MSRARRLSWAVALGVAFVLVPAVSPGEPQNAQELVREAVRLLEQERAAEALEELDRAIEEDPGYPPAHLYRGYALGQMGRREAAQQAFLRAVELNPGWPDAHRMAAIASFHVGDYETAWEQAIQAHLAGVDMSQGFEGLRQVSRQPADLERRLNAPRVFVGELETSGLEARTENPFGRNVDVSGAASRPEVTAETAQPPPTPGAGDAGAAGGRPITSGSKATGTGQRALAEAQADLAEMLRQTRDAVSDSPDFGLVPRREMADYVLIIEVDDLAETAPRKLDGYIKLYDARTGEEIYRRVLTLRNISAVADLNADINRYVDYMEQWLRSRG